MIVGDSKCCVFKEADLVLDLISEDKPEKYGPIIPGIRGKTEI